MDLSEFVADDVIVLNFLCEVVDCIRHAWRIPHMLDELNDDSILKTGRFPRYPRSLLWG
jgi:hypothetical protein